jgi:hypothetical protein
VNYVQLCQRLHLESGSGPGEPGTQPTATTAQTGKLLSIVTWVNFAYRTIQNSKRFWRWMIAEATGVETIAIGASSVTLLGASSNFDRLLAYDPNGRPYVLFYQSSIGTTDAQECWLIPWSEFNGYYDSGRFSASSGRPQFCAVAPNGTLRFHPKASVEYKIKYMHKTTIQELSATTDTPTMPTKFHDLIWMLALVMYGQSNEANRVISWLGNGLTDTKNPNGALPALYRQLCREQMADSVYFGER